MKEITETMRKDDFYRFSKEHLFDPYDCSWLLLLAFSDVTGLTQDQCQALGKRFRTGMGVRGTCGLLTSALMILALGNSDKDSKWMVESFREMCGSCDCQDIMPVRGRDGCLECMKATYDLLTEYALPNLSETFTIEQALSGTCVAHGKTAGFELELRRSSLQAAVANIPAGTTSIGADAFTTNNAIETVIIPEGVHTIGPRAFYACSRLKEVRLPSSLRQGIWRSRTL